VLVVYVVILNVAFVETCVLCVCVHRNFKSSVLRDLRLVLFFIDRNVMFSSWRDLRLVLFVYIVMLNVAFGETCVLCSLFAS
jgi:hypothetical protein